MHAHQSVVLRRSHLLRLAPTQRFATRPRAVRPSVEDMLREIAYVLHCTKKVKTLKPETRPAANGR